MVRSSMKVNYPGLIKEPLPSGQFRYRVRERGNPKNRIRIYCSPSDEDFTRQYTLARLGEQPKPLVKAVEVAKPKSIGWLVNSYFDYLEKRVASGNTSPKTLKKKRNLLNRHLDDRIASCRYRSRSFRKCTTTCWTRQLRPML